MLLTAQTHIETFRIEIRHSLKTKIFESNHRSNQFFFINKFFLQTYHKSIMTIINGKVITTNFIISNDSFNEHSLA